MNLLRSVSAVLRFELRRAVTRSRILGWLAVTAFPIVMVILTQWRIPSLPKEPWSILLFVLYPMLLTMLGTFLWSSPAIAAELERRSWIFLAVRPSGRIAVLLGKYLATVAWVLPSSLVSLAICMLIARTEDNLRVGAAIGGLTMLAVPAYAALYLLIGTLFPKRAMVVAVGYTLIFEMAISFIPALVNRLTIQYRLHALLPRWAAIELPEDGPRGFRSVQLLGNEPEWLLVASTIVYTLLLLGAAVVVIRSSEFSAVSESDV